MFVLWWKVFLADFVGGGFHPFVEPWFILFLVLFLDSLPAFSGIDYSSAFSESLSVQSNVSSSQLSYMQWLSPGSHFPFVELCDNFFSCISVWPEEICIQCARKDVQTTERKSKKAICFSCIRIYLHFISQIWGTLTFICAGWERHIRGSAFPKPAEIFNSEKSGITISCFVGLITHHQRALTRHIWDLKTVSDEMSCSDGVVDMQSRLRQE